MSAVAPSSQPADGRSRRRWRAGIALACIVAAAPLTHVACRRASFQVRVTRCFGEAQAERRRCLDDLEKIRIPGKRFLMEAFVRNCSIEAEYRAERCTHE